MNPGELRRSSPKSNPRNMPRKFWRDCRKKRPKWQGLGSAHHHDHRPGRPRALLTCVLRSIRARWTVPPADWFETWLALGASALLALDTPDLYGAHRRGGPHRSHLPADLA